MTVCIWKTKQPCCPCLPNFCKDHTKTRVYLPYHFTQHYTNFKPFCQ